MKYLLKLLVVVILTLFSGRVNAQDTISMSNIDDEILRKLTIPELIKNFENALNIISDFNSEPFDVKTIIDNLINDSSANRSFYDNNVIIENDLDINSTGNSTKGDLQITDYLENFNLMYPKTQLPSITLRIIQISNLKRTSYLFYNVLYESTYNNINKYGIPYRANKRLAEICLTPDTVWRAYIKSISFAPVNYNINDKKNNFEEFVEDFTQSMQYKIEQLELKKEEQKRERLKLNQIIAEGDNFALRENFIEALEKYQSALAFDIYNDELKEKIKNCQQALEIEKKKRDVAAELLATITRIKTKAKEHFSEYNFVECKKLYDSLIVYYGQSNEPDLLILGNDLSFVLPIIEKYEILAQENDYKGFLKFAHGKIKSINELNDNNNDILIAEILYRSAIAIAKIDSNEHKTISDFAEAAIKKSNYSHLLCGQLLVKLWLLNSKNTLKALEIATNLKNRYPSNSTLRSLRAEVLDSLKDYKNAINEYQFAIELKSKDKLVFINKARLEYLNRQYLECIETFFAGIKVFPCNVDLYYYKILSEEKLELFAKAGKDFQQAKKCGLKGNIHDTIIEHGVQYYKKGVSFIDQQRFDSAISYFDRSFKLCENLDALFYRGYCYNIIDENEAARDDLNILIIRDSVYNDAYLMRAIINASMGNHMAAISDFKKQIYLKPVNWKAYAFCGDSHFKMGDFKEAAVMFANSNRINYKDSIAAKALNSFYLNRTYEDAITLATNYIVQQGKNYEQIYKFRGMSEYKIGSFENARNDLEHVITKTPNDFETNLILTKTLVALNKLGDAKKYADRSCFICNNCPEALVWSGISQITLQQPKGIESAINKIKKAIEMEPKLNTAANLAWIAYGYLLSRNDMDLFKSNLLMAQNADSTDPIVLFVSASYQAENPTNRIIALKTLETACELGFVYKSLIQKDPILRNCKNEPQFKSIMEIYFKN